MRRPAYIHELFIYIRIKDWLHILGLAILGMAFYSYPSLFTHQSLLGLIASSLYLAHGFSLNNYFDITIDQYINKKFLQSDRVSKKKFLAFSYFLFFINCLVSYKISTKVLYFVILGSMLTLIYSAPPFRLKKYTSLNIFLNSIGFSLIFLIGFASVSDSITPAALMMAVLFALVFIPLQIVHQISHSEADKKEAIMSICNRYGLKIAIFLLNMSLVLLALWSFLIGAVYHRYINIFYLTSLFCLLFFYSSRRIKNSKKPCHESSVEIRFLLRKICVLYGLAMIAIFYFAN